MKPITLIITLALGVLSMPLLAQKPSGQPRLLNGIEESRQVVDGAERVKLRHPGHNRTFVLNDAVTELREIVLAPGGGQVVAVGLAGGPDSVDVVDFAAGKHRGSFLGWGVSVSPDGGNVVFEAFQGPAATSGAQYMRLEVMGETSGVLTPARFWPAREDRSVHSRRSKMFWVEADIAAFLDYVPGKAQVVVLDVSGPRERVVTYDLPVTELVDTEILDKGVDPAAAVSGTGISTLPALGDGLDLRLTFPKTAGLKVQRLDITVWTSRNRGR